MRRNPAQPGSTQIDHPFNNASFVGSFPGNGSFHVRSATCPGPAPVPYTCLVVQFMGLSQTPCIKLFTFIPADDTDLGIVQIRSGRAPSNMPPVWAIQIRPRRLRRARLKHGATQRGPMKWIWISNCATRTSACGVARLYADGNRHCAGDHRGPCRRYMGLGIPGLGKCSRQEQVKEEISVVVRNIRAYYGGQDGIGNGAVGTFGTLDAFADQ